MDHTDTPPEKQSQAGGWTRVDNAVLPKLAVIGQSAIGVYVALKSYADADGVCWPSLDAIAQLSGASKRTCIRCLAVMMQRGLITRTIRNQGTGRASNLYRFTDSPSATVATGVTPQVPKVMTPSAKSDDSPSATVALEQDLFSEQEPKNKTQPKRERAPIDPRLLEVIDQWNQAARQIGAATVRRDPPSKAMLANWKRLDKDAELREAFQDVPGIMAAVLKAKGAHGKSWFDLEFLFTRHPERHDLRVHRLLKGVYDKPYSSNGSTGNRRASGYGPGQVFDPNSEPQGGRVTDF